MGSLIGFSILPQAYSYYHIIYPGAAIKSIKICKFKKLGLSISGSM